MNFDAKEFPLYELLLTLAPETESAELQNYFMVAKTGDAEAKYTFASFMAEYAGINGGVTVLPGFTPAMRDQTLAKALEVFETLAREGHAESAATASHFYRNGYGCKMDQNKANELSRLQSQIESGKFSSGYAAKPPKNGPRFG